MCLQALITGFIVPFLTALVLNAVPTTSTSDPIGSLPLDDLQKLDPYLLTLVESSAVEMAGRLGIAAPDDLDRLPVIIRCREDVKGLLQDHGFLVRSVIRLNDGSYLVTADGTRVAITSIAKIPEIITIEASWQLHPTLDVSTREISVQDVWSQPYETYTSIQGQDVIVAVVDSGIDWRHEDFKDAPNRSRILSIWDQTATGTPPSGYEYGNECSRAQINASNCSQRDTSGHGTHVAGIAAGNGRSYSTTNYSGIAPRADLLIVKSDLSTDHIIDAWKWIITRAISESRPVVINNSFGGHSSAHDGSDVLSATINSLSHNGVVFVVAAGNDGNSNIHARAQVQQNQTVTTTFAYLNPTTSPYSTTSWINLWYPGTDSLDFYITDPNGRRWGPTHKGELNQYQSSSGDFIRVDALRAPWSNGDNWISVLITRTNTAITGNWSFAVQGITVTHGVFHAWLPLGGNVGGAERFTSNVDTQISLTEPGVAERAITVASYTTRDCWYIENAPHYFDLDRRCYNPKPAVGQISPFSSRGPTRDGRTKPDLAAPGMVIASSLSQDSSVSDDWILRGGHHRIMQGTSMAAPHVTGVVALMLQVSPQANADTIRQALRASSFRDTATGNVWNSTWGMGKLRAPAAVSAIRFRIIVPGYQETVWAGPAISPVKIVLKTTKPTGGLRPSDFNVQIGGRQSAVATVAETVFEYVLEVIPPVQMTNGLYDLVITVQGKTDTRAQAVFYAEQNNVDVALVIDRSGSMGTTKMNAAKDAAKQFVDLMQYGDMIGVVSFDDRIETNYPLTTITRPAAVPPLFSDDVESGTSKWQADAPWGLTTASSHSPSHAWTDSPSGDYGNNVNVALRTATPILVSNAITTPVLTFWQRYDLESGYDKGYVEISTNGGASWTQLGSYVTGTNLTWHIIERDLTPYKGQNVLIRFRLQTDSSVTRDGWYIDDVLVGQSIVDIKTQAKSAIDSLTSRGSTSIGGGLQRGQEQLSTRGQANHPWAIVLLSDGLENTAPYVRDVLPAIKASKTTVHTVGLGSDADEALMLDIAAQTGGTYNFAPTPQELAGIYNTIAGAVANRQTLLTATGVAQQGVTDQKDVVIDSTVSDATFSLSWSNSSSTIDFILRKPNGQIIDPTVAASDPNVEYVAGSTYKYYRVIRPTLVTGVWQMRITGGSVTAAGEKGVIASPAGESYTVRVTAQAVLTARFYLDRSSYLTTEPIKFVVTLSDQQPIRNATVQVSAQAPSQAAAAIRSSEWISVNDDAVPDPAKVAEFNALYAQPATTITLYDDGLHDDGPANDGVYANTFSGTNRPGTWVFSMSAGGLSNLGETFIRFAEISTFIAPNPNPRIRQLYLPLVIRDQPGATWRASNLTGRTVLDLASSNSACNTLLAATDAGVYRSTDGGRSWTWVFAPAAASLASGPAPAYEDLAQPAAGMATAVAVCPANPDIAYASSWGSGVYRSADGGATWQQRAGGLSDPWIYDLAVAPNNCSVVYAATSSNGVFKTTDGGGWWQNASAGLGNGLTRSLAVAPGNPSRLYAGTTGGVYRSDNAAASWVATGSLPGTSVWGLAIEDGNADLVYAGLDGYGVYRSLNAGSIWSQADNGLGNAKVRALIADPLAASTLYAGRDDGGGVYRSLDSGGSWTAFNNGLGSGNVKALWLDGGSCRRLLAGTTNGAWYYGP